MRGPSGWSIHKVTAHVPDEASTGPLEDWAYWNNQAADREAHAQNMARDPAFWQLWQTVKKDQVLQAIRGSAMLARLRDIARAATQVSPVQESAPASVDGTPPTLGRLCPPLPKHLAKFGLEFVMTLEAWLYDKVNREAPLRWVSCLHLYLLFEHDTGLLPPVFDQGTKSWRSYSKAGIGAGLVDLPERVFRLQVRAVVSRAGGKVHAAEIRPFSTAIQVKLPSLFLPWPAHEFNLLEDHLTTVLDMGSCVQNERSWALVPFL